MLVGGIGERDFLNQPCGFFHFFDLKITVILPPQCITDAANAPACSLVGGAFQIFAWRAGTWPRPYENRVVGRGAPMCAPADVRVLPHMHQVKDFRG